MNERDGKFLEMDCGKGNDHGWCITASYFVDHPILADINGDGISDILGFELRNDPNQSSADEANTSLFCQAGVYQENVHQFRFKRCEQHFPVLNKPSTNFAPIFADLDGDLSSELVFVDTEENSSTTRGKRRLVVWKLAELSDRFGFKSLLINICWNI
jgi:hypothetical protein